MRIDSHRTRPATSSSASHRGPVLGPTTSLFALLFCLAGAAAASNGMNMIGYGAESIALGGADLALGANPSSMNINPAGIGLVDDRQIAFAAGWMDPSLTHSDRLGNRSDDVLDRVPTPFLGYVHPLEDFTVGIGVFVQGGMGAEYGGLATPFAARAGAAPPTAGSFAGNVPRTDSTLTRLAHAKLTPTVAWRARPGLTLGASLHVSYVTVDMQLFPETSVRGDLDGSGTAGDSPADSFFGLDAEDVSGVGYGIRVGLHFQRGRLAVGSSYVTETELELDGGTMHLNLSALGLGKVPYDCRMSGLSWPQQAGVGLAYQVHPRLRIAADVDWVDWSGAMSIVRIDLENPGLPQAPGGRQIPLPMGWRDQWVSALGLELTGSPNWALRLGYNHGESPIPDDMLRPLFPAIAENHLTAGAGLVRGRWTLDLGFEYVLESQMTNNGRDPAVNPFGPGSQETLSQFAGHLMVRRSLVRRVGKAASG